ncbi:DAK2 domain-containing protein [Shouchella sp. JSM 1781072]|uniref:DAK2 domain-containing protein n=1 Tax=Bacillaceae TaxID=186817 RepID=UPI00159B9DA5|nr:MULTISPECIES: DAK2 domain-containing protein [Bacillaceae]UTR08512.1 DAK2 domain-containing protein [Alkalihalobacillus sp. LMS6]
MFIEGANELGKKADVVDSLNVFPVPDGDTGTNMNLTITSGVKEVRQQAIEEASKVAGSFAKGLLMGARGNSGVILSQLFRGFSKEAEGKTELTTEQFAQAMDAGVKTAYKAVMKPVEGTILTVAKDMAKHAVKIAKKETAFEGFLTSIIKEGERSLAKTPDLLPVLKEVGVVDSGGQGLLYIYAGFLQALTGGETIRILQEPKMDEMIRAEHHHDGHGDMDPSDIEFGYCTEVMVKFDAEQLSQNPYDEDKFRLKLSEFGDSLLVVSDDDLLKIHIHAEYPGQVVTEAQAFGSLVQVKVENMREQQSNLSDSHAIKKSEKASKPKEQAEFAMVAVSVGAGIEKIFKGLGVNEVVAGGQTMNPSTEDIVQAIKHVHAKNVIILPNNSNIVMSAEQAAEVADVNCVVVPTKTVPQGLAALLAFNPGRSVEENASAMEEAMKDVKTGEVTYAVRDTEMDGQSIKTGDYMGIYNKKIVACGQDVFETAQGLLNDMLEDDSEVVTIITGEDSKDDVTKQLEGFLENHKADVEIDVVEGGQPLYSYIFSVE